MNLTKSTLANVAVGMITASSIIGAFSNPGVSFAASQKVYTIALANSYIGNGWRVEMEHVLEAEALMPGFKGKVNLKVENSANSVSAQIASIDNMIAAHVSAILVDAASPSGINAVIAQAHQQGIPVIAFDNNVTSPYAYNLVANQMKFGKIGATFLVHALHGKGNIIMNRGVAGTPADIQRAAGAMSVFKKYPGIHVVDQIYGNWDPATTRQQFTTALASYPNVDGLWSEGGTYGAIQALLAEKHKLFPIAGEASNGFRMALATLKNKGLTGISVGQPPFFSALALKYAIQILEGKKIPHTITVQSPVLTSSQIKIGVNAFPNLPSSTYDDFEGDGLKFTVQQMETGK